MASPESIVARIVQEMTDHMRQHEDAWISEHALHGRGAPANSGLTMRDIMTRNEKRAALGLPAVWEPVQDARERPAHLRVNTLCTYCKRTYEYPAITCEGCGSHDLLRHL